MLASRQRLRRRDDFTATLRRGRRVGRGALVVHLLASGAPARGESAGDQPSRPARAGFVVPRSVGSAVERNRVRRRLRHLMHPGLDQLPPGTDVVVRVLPGAAEQSYERLGADLDAAVSAARSRPGRGRSVGAGRRGKDDHAGPLKRATEAVQVDASVAAGSPRAEGPGGDGSGPIARALTGPIKVYRRWISPALPPRCRFYPSCSEYALTAITTHGPVRGLLMSVWRLLRCQPFHPGGFDPVPPARRRRPLEHPNDPTGAVI